MNENSWFKNQVALEMKVQDIEINKKIYAWCGIFTIESVLRHRIYKLAIVEVGVKTWLWCSQQKDVNVWMYDHRFLPGTQYM